MEAKINILLIGVLYLTSSSSNDNNDIVSNGFGFYPDDEFVDHINSRHLYHAYTFLSGVGNRERLEVDRVNVDPNLKVGEGVKEWTKLKLKEELYLVGLQNKGFTVIKVKQVNSTSVISDIKIDLEHAVAISAIFEYRNPLTKHKEVILILVINQGLYNCLWYRLKDNMVEKFWELPLLKRVTSLEVFKYENDYNIIFAHDHGIYGSSLEIFRVEFNNSVPFIWFLQLIPLKYTVNSIAFTHVNAELYMSVVQKSLNMILIFKYQPFCPETNEGKFVNHESIISENVTAVNTFYMANQNFLLVNGIQANIYLFTWNSEVIPVFNNKIGFIEDWLVIEVETYRYDVILLAKRYTETLMITWLGSLDGFTITKHPSCYHVNERHEKVAELSSDLACMNNFSWNGAVSTNLGHLPVLILVGTQYSQMYHFVYSLIPVTNPEWDILRVEHFKNILKEEWNILKHRYEDYGVEVGYDEGLNIALMKKASQGIDEIIRPDYDDWPSSVDLANLLNGTLEHMSVIEENLIKCESTLYSRNNSFHAYFEGERGNRSETLAGYFNSSFEGYLLFDEPLIMERRENETITFKLNKNNSQIAAHGMLTFVVGGGHQILHKDLNNEGSNTNVEKANTPKNLVIPGLSNRYSSPAFTPEIMAQKQLGRNSHISSSLGDIVDEGLNTEFQNLPHYYSLKKKKTI